MTLRAERLHELQGLNSQSLDELRDTRVHAVAAIGHPERFFQTLEQAGLELISHAFPDHHAYQQSDFDFSGTGSQSDEVMIIMTEKDAVKCRTLQLKNAWYLPVSACLDGDLAGSLLRKLRITQATNNETTLNKQ